MKILLTTLNSKYIHSNLAIKYLYSAAIDSRSLIDIKEFSINQPDDFIYTEIMRGRYEIVCFSCYIWNIEKILYLAENIKKSNWRIKIVLGGPEVSYETGEFLLKHDFIDIIISGEGERAFKRLMETLGNESQELEKIKGLSYRHQGTIYVNPLDEILTPDEIPFPYEMLQLETDKIVYYESVRGCPFKCAFCLSSIEKSIRELPIERVKTELDYFLYKGTSQVKFIDRTFNYNKARAIEIINYIVKNDNGITNFHFEMCPDLIDEDIINALREGRKNLFQLEIGIQSTNITSLKACNRMADFSGYKEKILELVEMRKINIHLDLIAGLPFEDYSSFRDSFNDVYSLKPNQLQLGFLKLIKGTNIRAKAEEYRYIYREKPPYEVISNIFISPMEIVKLKMIENVLDLYYNKGGFTDTLEYCTSLIFIEPFDFYEEFSNFFYLKGFQNRAHSKENLYRILLKYGKWKERLQTGINIRIEELLKWDMSTCLNPEAIKNFERKGWEI
jgi:radical SAM superfamily enzyme YgiQ (UPF0313 family)